MFFAGNQSIRSRSNDSPTTKRVVDDLVRRRADMIRTQQPRDLKLIRSVVQLVALKLSKLRELLEGRR